MKGEISILKINHLRKHCNYTVRSIYYAYVLTKDIFVHSRFINGWCRNSENRNLPANVVNFTIIPFHRHG